MEIFQFIQSQLSYLRRRTITIQDAEDIIQDVYEIVWNRRSYFNNKPLEEQRKIIIYCIRNRFIDKYRKTKRGRNVIDTKGLPRYTSAEAFSKMELKEIRNMIEKNSQRIQLLSFVWGYSTQEISDNTGTKLNTVLSNIYKTRNYLKKQYA